MTDGIFNLHELKTIEVDVEKKVFKINGEDFGRGCTGFTITCNGYNNFSVRAEVDTTVQFATFNGNGRASYSEHPAMRSWYTDGKDDNDGVIRVEVDRQKIFSELIEEMRDKHAEGQT